MASAAGTWSREVSAARRPGHVEPFGADRSKVVALVSLLSLPLVALLRKPQAE